ncbi:hypothetical protein V2J09_024058 [Rumex salicifolius]
MEYSLLSFITFTLVLLTASVAEVNGNWCVARSDAGADALQAALDYACGGGADCAPIEPTGLCYLPNTLAAHASYAFNSFYQRNNLADRSCDFAGSATLANNDPSYGSCVFPPNPSSAGELTMPSTGTTPPATPSTNTNTGGGGGGVALQPTYGPSSISTSTRVLCLESLVFLA